MIDIKVRRTPGRVIDQLDDPGFGFDKMASEWPEEMENPLGRQPAGHAYAAMVDDGLMKRSAYPINSPEEALASSMYFVMYGAALMVDDQEALKKVAFELREARLAHGVVLDSGFGEFVKRAMRVDPPPMEVYADSVGHLPVTTPDQLMKSAELFKRYEDRWDPSDAAAIASRMHKVAAHLGVGFEHDLPPHEEWDLAESFFSQMDKRARLVSSFEDYDDKDVYLWGCQTLKEAAVESMQNESKSWLVDVIEAVQELDKSAGLEHRWNRDFLDPARSVLVNRPEPSAMDSIREQTHQGTTRIFDKSLQVDGWDKMASDKAYPQDLIDYVKESPQERLPQLPPYIREGMEKYLGLT